MTSTIENGIISAIISVQENETTDWLMYLHICKRHKTVRYITESKINEIFRIL